MKFSTNKMNSDEAKEISKWTYQEPYSMYNMDEGDSCINELLNDSYFSVKDEYNNLIGFYCLGVSAQVPAGKQFGVYNDNHFTDIGLGIKPSFCSQGLGFNFLCYGLEFAQNKLSITGFRLTVAAFNKRAIKIYERIGFKKVNSFIRLLEKEETEFWIMTL